MRLGKKYFSLRARNKNITQLKHNMNSYPLVKQEDTVDSKELSDLPIVLYIARSREERRSSTSLLDNCKAILSTKTISFQTKLTDFQTFQVIFLILSLKRITVVKYCRIIELYSFCCYSSFLMAIYYPKSRVK